MVQLDDTTKITLVTSNFSTGVAAPIPVPTKVMRGEWIIADITYAQYPNQAKSLGTLAKDMYRPFPFSTKHAALEAWQRIYGEPAPYTAGQLVWHYRRVKTLGGRSVSMRLAAVVVTCTKTHALINFSLQGEAKCLRVPLAKVEARKDVAA